MPHIGAKRRQGRTEESLHDWLRQGRGMLFLPYQADQVAALRSIIATWMRLAIFQTMPEGEGDRRI